jgi:hypothetical protein
MKPHLRSWPSFTFYAKAGTRTSAVGNEKFRREPGGPRFG